MSPSNGSYYTTTAIAADPTNPTTLFATANDTSLGQVTGFVSRNGGTSWQISPLPPAVSQPNAYSYWPGPAYDDRGDLYQSYMPYAAHGGSQLVVAKSGDKGRDWGNSATVEPTASAPEEPLLAVDRSGGSFHNRLYMAYDTNPTTTSEPIVVAQTDNGVSWHSTLVADGGGDFGAAPAVGPQGQVYVAWDNWAWCPAAGCGSSGAEAGRIAFASSADGGRTFSLPSAVAATHTGIGQHPNYFGAVCNNSQPLVSSLPSIDVDRSIGIHQGTIYLAWADQPAGSAIFHIFFTRSADGGQTWSLPVQLDTHNFYADAWSPSLAVDQSTGIVSVAWYDRRDSNGTSEPGRYRVYYTESTDGGATFLPTQAAISDFASDPSLSCFGTGDYMQMVAVNGVAHPVWVDTRNGYPQIFTAAVDEARVAQALRPAPGYFGTRTDLSLPAPGQVAVGDFNEDGIPDVAVALYYWLVQSGWHSTISIALGNGDGTFRAGNTYTVPDGASGIAAGDLNGDQHLDLFIAGPNGASVFLGKGDGTFALANSYAFTAPSPPTSVALGDINGDGKLDVAFTGGGSQFVSPPSTTILATMLGNGDGTLQPPQILPETRGTAVAMADLDKDGKLDLAVSDGYSDLELYFGNGDGTFQPPQALPPNQFFAPALSVVIGDFNGDGNPDIVVAAGGSLAVYLGTGHGIFTETTEYGTTPGGDIPGNVTGGSLYMAVADINRDGIPDLVILGHQAAVFLGNGDGTFGPEIDAALPGNSGLALADLNKDGRPDIVSTTSKAVGAFTPSSLSALLGVAANAVAQTTPVNFGGVTLGNSAATQTVNLSNSGNQDLHVILTEVTRLDAQDFSEVSDTCRGTTAPPGTGCAVIVRFTPTAGGNRSATLEFADDAGIQSVPLTGLGMATSQTMYTVASGDQYQLYAPSGTRWADLDTSNMQLAVTPAVDSLAIISGNADFWTQNAGYNQDLGIAVSGGVYPTTAGQPEAWKESGGFAGTFSPNAAYLQAVLTFKANTTYQVNLQWKTNKAAPGVTIRSGAGPGTPYSPTRLTAQLVPVSASSVVDRVSEQQYRLAGSDGATWQTLDPANLTISYTPAGDGVAVLGGNADLWTSTSGFNQDLGVAVSGGTYPAVLGQPESWKESGGFAGTFSPNAAYVQAVVPMKANINYQLTLVWKANRPDAGTIWAGAGPIGPNFSPTDLSMHFYAAATPNPAMDVSSALQFALTGNDGQTWTDMDSTRLVLPISSKSMCTATLSANADLWTQSAGYNQDLGIMVNDGTADHLVTWKESGGYAGTYSPNAAFAQAVVTLSPSTSYEARLVWKANRPDSGTIEAGAGPIGVDFSPTRLTVQLDGCS